MGAKLTSLAPLTYIRALPVLCYPQLLMDGLNISLRILYHHRTNYECLFSLKPTRGGNHALLYNTSNRAILMFAS